MEISAVFIIFEISFNYFEHGISPVYLYLYGFEFPNINYTSLTTDVQEEVIFLRLLPYLLQHNPGRFLLFTFQTLFTNLADCSCRCN